MNAGGNDSLRCEGGLVPDPTPPAFRMADGCRAPWEWAVALGRLLFTAPWSLRSECGLLDGSDLTDGGETWK